jgi:23S rRNA (adenine2503-C2)-methyltransferase
MPPAAVPSPAASSTAASSTAAPVLAEALPLKPRPAPARPSLLGLPRDALEAALVEAGVEARAARMRARQLWGWLYRRGARSFDQMTDLSKPVRALLAERFRIDRPEVVSRQLSADGTRKWLLRLDGGHEVEAVHIPEEDRGTLCVSSQVGCTLTCTFCHTGTQRLVRNLTAAEIVGQILVCRDELGEWPQAGGRPPERRLLSNVVLMGMGEPLYNFEAVRDAMRVAMDGDGLSLSRRRITLSTSGVVPMIPRAGAEIGTLLAISLHAVEDDLRDVLVPINRKWNIAALLDACRAYPRLSNAERITFEYVMLKGVNDSDAAAKKLVRLIAGIPAKINLIPFNPWPGSPYERSDWERIETFAEIVNRAGYASPVRTPRGQDILAACGQLKSATERGRRSRAEVAAEAAG